MRDDAHLPLFAPERIVAGAAKLRQAARDRVAEQRAVVARDYSAEWTSLVERRPEVADRVTAIALAMADRKSAGTLYVASVWDRYGEEHGEALDHNLRAPAARWLMATVPALAGRFRIRGNAGQVER